MRTARNRAATRPARVRMLHTLMMVLPNGCRPRRSRERTQPGADQRPRNGCCCVLSAGSVRHFTIDLICGEPKQESRVSAQYRATARKSPSGMPSRTVAGRPTTDRVVGLPKRKCQQTTCRAHASQPVAALHQRAEVSGNRLPPTSPKASDAISRMAGLPSLMAPCEHFSAPAPGRAGQAGGRHPP